MSSAKKIGVLGAAVGILLTVVIYAQEGEELTVFKFLQKSEFQGCGLHKLTAEEQAKVFSIISVTDLPSYCEEAAEAYMKDKDWFKIRVIGAIPDKTWPREYVLFVSYNYRIYRLDPFSTPFAPEPGVYWAKKTGSSWDILFPDGREYDFSEVGGR